MISIQYLFALKLFPKSFRAKGNNQKILKQKGITPKILKQKGITPKILKQKGKLSF